MSGRAVMPLDGVTVGFHQLMREFGDRYGFLPDEFRASASTILECMLELYPAEQVEMMFSKMQRHPQGDNSIMGVRLVADENLDAGVIEARGGNRTMLWPPKTPEPPRPRTRLSARASRRPLPKLAPRVQVAKRAWG